MIVTFTTRMPIAETMQFEATYEPSLQMDLEEKSSLVAESLAAWMFVDGVLAGEIYGAQPALLNDTIPDTPKSDPRMIYCYSTTLLPAFRRRGLSKILVAYWNGLARGAGFTKVDGHATSPAMVAVRAFFGARFGPVHPNWYETNRTAHYYECDL